VNSFDMTAVKRQYVIEIPDTTIVRAWQGHKKEQKWFYVVAGSFKVLAVKPDNWLAPSADLPVEEFEITAATPEILHIPGGYANGFKALSPASIMIVFSDFGIEDTAKDDFRFASDLWYNWNKI
jgi:dTDP-4-dehydrorhamnose 3,5-epimerase-like enzyme